MDGIYWHFRELKTKRLRQFSANEEQAEPVTLEGEQHRRDQRGSWL